MKANPRMIRTAKMWDAVARYGITVGGAAIIIGVILILLLIVGVTLPLFEGSKAEVILTSRAPAELKEKTILKIGVEMGVGGEPLVAYFLTEDGAFLFYNLINESILGSLQAEPPEGSEAKRLLDAERHAGTRYSLLWEDGSTTLEEVTLARRFNDLGEERIEYDISRRAALLPVEGEPVPESALVRYDHENEVTTRVVRIGPRGVRVARQVREAAGLFGEGELVIHRFALDAAAIPGAITAMTMDELGKTLYAGTENGALLRWVLEEAEEAPAVEVTPAFHDERAITALTMVFGGYSLAVGDANGGLRTWFPVRSNGDRKLKPIHPLQTHSGAVIDIISSRRNKSLLSLGANGVAHLDHMTSERFLEEFPAPEPLAMVAFPPRGAALLGMNADRRLTVWDIDNPHPEVSWKTLFGMVHYEGYDDPDYVWQTTGGEDFEPKFSLMPLLFGTFKGTFYAMILAVPLALFGAVYTSQFTHPDLKKWIKPVVEIMAAIPSVVIGFLIALWLAPIIESWVVAFFLCFLTIPLVFFGFMMIWQVVREQDWAKYVERGYEFFALIPILVIGILLAVAVTPWIESTLFEGNFRLWLYQNLDWRYDQRNCIIIAFGLGFAVIPIIFSIAEDSLSNVPPNLTAASLALGASRWQTVWRVVLPSASPGIFAAIMIGLGRAVGETMIVLMATGNTPIMDWSPFNGMRTLSANIAVEIPEAPVGGTLYRVLFLCAVVLFILTFTLNTAAEVIRERLRKKYGRF